ncbi:MAG: XRE family transcriptional regulator [Bacillota bacterium]
MANSVVGIQPSVLRWARQSQGYSIEEVAHQLKRDPAEVEAWEAGIAAPTYTQLEVLAYKLYKRPLAVFFLPAPPAERNLKKDFRTLPDFELDQLSPDTRYQLRLAYAYQNSLRELNNGVNPANRKIFRDITISATSDVFKVATSIRDYLGISLDTQSRWRSDEDAFKAWRNSLEDVGVFVFKRAFKQKAISGFCLADDEFPIIYLNNSTAKTRQIFSLFHEIVHLLLKINAISKYDRSYIEYLPRKEKRIEQFCNAVAAEVLIPSGDFTIQISSLTHVDDESIGELAKRYHVSRETVLRRMLDRGLIEQAYYEDKAKEWAAEAEKHGTSGGDYYATQAAYLGERYLRLVFSMHYQGRLSLEEVADHLGVRTKNVAGLEAFMVRKEGAI